MSLLIPANLSDAYKGKQKPDKNNLNFAAHGGEGPATEMLDESKEPKVEENKISVDEQLRKRVPVPVALVDPDPVQMMDPDEYGAELGKEARVWKVYVQETDKWDRELVDGWNRSLDVILVFAALFSAVSTSFLIESSGMLQQDPNDVSAKALVAISQALLAIANNSTVDLSSSTLPGPNTIDVFEPSRHAMIVNTLWFLSLSLSIATSLLAMLAKDWCHSFIANRTGHPWDQSLRRQRKWVMIEHWKMQELIVILPSLIHLSLLLFAIGLCIYVWDINTTAAIPIVCVSGSLFAFYLWSSFMASLLDLFPYTTIISKGLQSDYMQCQCKRLIIYGKWLIVQILSIISKLVQCLLISPLAILLLCLALVCLPVLIVEISYWAIFSRWSYFDLTGTCWWFLTVGVIDTIEKYMGIDPLFEAIRMRFAHAKKYVELKRSVRNDQGQMISLALKWLIQNCETPSSIAIALQAIAGASSRIPVGPLKACQATIEIFRRLVSSNPDSQTKVDAELYTRALAFLESNTSPDNRLHAQTDMDEKEDVESNHRAKGIEVILWDLKVAHEQHIVELINNTQIMPTKENIHALSIGSSATSLGLRLLKGDSDIKPAYEVFGSIMEQLCATFSGSRKLDPAALQSLANASIVLTLCSNTSLFSLNVLQTCFTHCSIPWSTRVSRQRSSQSQTASILATETVFIICILLHTSASTHHSLHQLQLGIPPRTQQAADLFTSNYLNNSSSQSTFYCIGLLAVLFYPEQYGIPWDTGNVIARDQTSVCARYLTSELLLSIDTQRGLRNQPEPVVDNSEIFEFLLAVDRVSMLVELRTPQMNAMALPAPVYCVVILLSCTLQMDIQQAQCQKLLSRSGFPKLDKNLLIAIQETAATRPLLGVLWDIYQASDPGPADTRSIFKRLRSQNTSVLFKARSRHFLATQLWLLLYLVGDSSDILQKRLEAQLEQKTGLGIRSRGVDAVRLDLEEEVIRGYEQGHKFGLYSARIIECILEGRSVSYHSRLNQRIVQDLKDVPSRLRGRSSFFYPPTDPQSELTTAPAVGRSNQHFSIFDLGSASKSPFTRARNRDGPLPTTLTPIVEYDEPGNDTASHMVIPVLPGPAGSENA